MAVTVTANIGCPRSSGIGYDFSRAMKSATAELAFEFMRRVERLPSGEAVGPLLGHDQCRPPTRNHRCDDGGRQRRPTFGPKRWTSNPVATSLRTYWSR